MDASPLPAPESDLRFLLSLLRIANPGEPAGRPTQSLEELLDAKPTR